MKLVMRAINHYARSLVPSGVKQSDVEVYIRLNDEDSYITLPISLVVRVWDKYFNYKIILEIHANDEYEILAKLQEI